jgi:hypothetical protein
MEINIINFTNDLYCEMDWLFYLLQKFKINKIINNEIVIVKNPIIIFNNYNKNININLINLLELYEKEHIKWIGIHLSDEECKDSMDYLNYLQCKLIFKNYYSVYNNSKLVYFGLGYISDLICNKKNIEIFDRKYIWSFIGDDKKQNRRYILEKYKSIKPYYIHTTSSWFQSDKNALSRKDYTEIIENSIFGLSPVGNINIDCFRLYELLECGTIPITIKTTSFQPFNYWEKIFKINEIPFICVDNFEEAKSIVLNLINTPELLLETHNKCKEFWKKYKNNLIDEFTNNITKIYL